MNDLRVEPGALRDFDPCTCCGHPTRALEGFVYLGPEPRAAYAVRWTPASPPHGAVVDLVLGAWGHGSGPGERRLVSLRYGPGPQGNGFRVVDARSSPGVAAQATRRDEVVGRPLGDEVMGLLDAIWIQDPRVPPSGV
jgi:hypothetical protein